MVAQQIEVEVEASEDVNINAIYATYKTEEVTKGKKYIIHFADLYSNEERDVICDLSFLATPQPRGNYSFPTLAVPS